MSPMRTGLRRRMLGIAGLSSLLAWAGSAGAARAGFTTILDAGESNVPIVNESTSTELTGVESPTLRVKAAPNHHALRAVGGDGEATILGAGGSGGDGIVATGGAAAGADKLTGGRGTIAAGGTATTGIGGIGAFLWGGAGSDAQGGWGLDVKGGIGIVAEGGRAKPHREAEPWGGEAIRAYGGTGFAPEDADHPDGDYNAGIVGRGGLNWAPNDAGAAGRGVWAEGVSPTLNEPPAPAAIGDGEAKGNGVYGETSSLDIPSITGTSGNAPAGVYGEAKHGTAISCLNEGGGPGGVIVSVTGTSIVAVGVDGIHAKAVSHQGVRIVAAKGAGVVGQGNDGIGIAGISEQGTGGYFSTEAAGMPAVVAKHTQATSAGGPVGLLIDGDCIIQNGLKSAAVRTSRGLTLLYVVESTTNVFEDVGKALLQNGRARVELDPLFAETIETGDYQVLLTPRGETRGVYLGVRDPRGFEIREQAGGASNVEVNYRIVGRRKWQRSGERLAPFKRPTAPPRPTPADLPPPPPKLRVPPPRPPVLPPYWATAPRDQEEGQ